MESKVSFFFVCFSQSKKKCHSTYICKVDKLVVFTDLSVRPMIKAEGGVCGSRGEGGQALGLWEIQLQSRVVCPGRYHEAWMNDELRSLLWLTTLSLIDTHF